MDYDFDDENFETPNGIPKEEDLFEILTTPDLSKVDPLLNNILSRDTILANLDERDYRNLFMYGDLIEFINLAIPNVSTYTMFADSLNRKAKMIALMSRGKYGFQSKLLKTQISIKRTGIEDYPEQVKTPKY
jgi:hypothetical protein